MAEGSLCPELFLLEGQWVSLPLTLALSFCRRLLASLPGLGALLMLQRRLASWAGCPCPQAMDRGPLPGPWAIQSCVRLRLALGAVELVSLLARGAGSCRPAPMVLRRLH